MLTNSVRNTECNPDQKRRAATAALRFFVFAGLYATTAISAAAADTACNSSLYDQQLTVTEVTDEPLLRLSNGRKLRLPSISFPQIDYRNTEEKLQLNAAHRLRERINPPAKILIRREKLDFDHRHNLVAHVFLADESNLQVWLLNQGLAVLDPQPEFPWSTKCYQQIERQARAQARGIWAKNRFAEVAIEEQTRLHAGYWRLNGKVTRVTGGSNTLWLHLNDQIAIRIEHEDRAQFSHIKLESLRSHQIRASGTLYPYKSGYNMRIRHPASLRIID